MADAGQLSAAQKDALALQFNQQLNPGGSAQLNQQTGMIDINAQNAANAQRAAAQKAAAIKAQTDPLLASLGSLDTILGNKNQQSQDEFGRAIAGYDAQDAIDRRNFDQNTFQNENTFTSNNQAALLNAANAGTGLKGVLSSLGGLAGSGVDVISRLVGLAANSDSGDARQTFETNATGLNNAWGQAEQQQRQRREDANATLSNNLMNNEANVLQSRQSIYQQLANAFGGNDARGAEYAGKAGALAAPIANTTRATVAPYQSASAAFSPGALQEYLGGTQQLDASATTNPGGSTPINSPLFGQKKKETLSGVA